MCYCFRDSNHGVQDRRGTLYQLSHQGCLCISQPDHAFSTQDTNLGIFLRSSNDNNYIPRTIVLGQEMFLSPYSILIDYIYSC